MARGFTLLEVLIAIVVLSVGVASIVWALSAGMYAVTDIENTKFALNIAQAKMEEVKNTRFADLLIGNNPEENSGFITTTDISENPATPGLKQVDVTVSWQAKGGETDITLTTLVTDASSP